MIALLKAARGWLLAPLLTLATTEANRKARGVMAVEIPATVVTGLNNWSEPVQIRFVPVGDAWLLNIRTLREAHEKMAAERAARQ